jgi:hypothetical protein
MTVMVWAHTAPAAPNADLWEFWTTHNPKSQVSVDHTVWQNFLEAHIVVSNDGVNRVAYEKVSPNSQQHVAGYIKHLTQLAPSTLQKNEQRTYWINLYNALTVTVVLDNYPVESILEIKISPGLFSPGPWGKKLIIIEGHSLSLDDIEHRILRPIWQDNRLHYALNCASVGCPNLINKAYTGANTDKLLSQAAHAYINHPRAARVEDGMLYVSSIYNWYKSDFGGSDTGVIAHLKKFADPALLKALSGITEIEDDSYDWSLNRTE